MYYSTIDKFFSDLHDLLSEDQNRGYPLIYRGPFNPPAERYFQVLRLFDTKLSSAMSATHFQVVGFSHSYQFISNACDEHAPSTP